MTIRLSPRVIRLALSILLTSLLPTLLLTLPLSADERNQDEHHHTKIVGAYFEEWSIYFAGYNIANLQVNGVAEQLTHLTYASVMPPRPGVPLLTPGPIINPPTFRASVAPRTRVRSTATLPRSSS